MKKLLKLLLIKPVKLINKLVLGIYLYISRNKANDIEPLDLSGQKILILAPHQDDEVLGCGCLIRKSLQKGSQVKCIYITDGSQSFSDKLSSKGLVEARMEEAIKLAKHIGMEEPIFLGCPDSTLSPNDKNAINDIVKVIEEFKPDAIFIPYFLDGHRDHTATSGLYLSSIDLLTGHMNFETYCYEINSPISACGVTHYVDCTNYMQAKKDDMKFYDSQSMSFESIFLMDRLNRILVGTKEGAELFRKINLTAYREVYYRYNINNNISNHFGMIYSIYFMLPAYFKGMKLKKKIACQQNSFEESYDIQC